MVVELLVATANVAVMIRKEKREKKRREAMEMEFIYYMLGCSVFALFLMLLKGGK